ncbi:hypothetical protein MEN41_02895 [Dolichospermum sp. ST_con]|nr:hypothetical protein [Dolichospermum sp. ST_con]MDD1418283.1 hypothetical protein [Dolichospermum sp. ST_sed1]MDD1423165.1 hypothetical protein [Dolichospermum sp. ST_sed9]MDD1429531.1 hypothetical protein [Dolichospermum sp. ST_sed6]MDD1436724.1 hypothetical protein [Dolichospermum sp. ST_sed10]MDD1438899.1 hypothetical protein [Dolichospermum sp. ST_sed3]MDD1444977.1 hypothetical protein [Dolichospermum sp. ST_sed8]MDD1453398.1 hypothetical protein [Dolichospermum sp. ST_sed7]MDD145888
MSKNILNLDPSFFLSRPEDISDIYNLHYQDKLKLCKIISIFQESIDAKSIDESVTKLSQAYSILGSFETFYSQKYLTLTGSLKKWEVEDYDCYFDVKREQAKNSSAFLVIRSILIAYKTFLNLRCFIQKENIDNPLLIWKRYHWLFFVFVQGNILCMHRLKKEMRKESMIQVGVILKSMSKLMLASGASMIFAGTPEHQEYENGIRPTMMPPNVNSADFSGLMSYDHAYLINLWNQEKKLFKLIPSFLSPAYEEFLKAHEFLALSHKFVCQKYGGDQTGSLRENRVTALENLEKINNSRRRTIISSDHQLLNPHSKLILTDESEYEEYIKSGFRCYG